MFLSDLSYVFFWWSIIFLLGSIFFPLTSKLFSNFIDKGYIFGKVLGIIILTYVSWITGILHILPFSTPSLLLIIIAFIFTNILYLIIKKGSGIKEGPLNWKLLAFEELLFFAALSFWSYIKAHQPDVNGLEKFMDFGFINSILRSDFFPPKDMWLTKSPEYPGFFINYYYFGHLSTAILTKITGINTATTFNLMLSTIFAFTFTCSFSIALNLMYSVRNTAEKIKILRGNSQGLINKIKSFWSTNIVWVKKIFFALLTAYLVTLSGNLHTMYAFTKSYTPADKPIPIWETFSQKTTTEYWYPNATRFIPYTIHEFPSYSFVVSDLHGHVLDIPFVLFTIALLLSFIFKNTDGKIQNSKFKIQNLNSKLKSFHALNLSTNFLTFDFLPLTFLGLSLAIMYMTNAWDGLIYFGLSALVILYIQLYKTKDFLEYILYSGLNIIFLLFLFFLFSLPFQLTFKPFVSGIGVVVKDRSPWWMLLTLWGFFYYCATGFIAFIYKEINKTNKQFNNLSIKQFNNLRLPKWLNGKIAELLSVNPVYIFLLLLIILSTGLLVFPEFFYIKDIYPTHYRANTMFKLGYQAFMMLSLLSGYVIYLFFNKSFITGKYPLTIKLLTTIYKILLLLFVFLVCIYPYYSVNSYFDRLKNYKGLYGMSYMKISHPDDFNAILWFNQNVYGQPVVLEAVGDSYTDYSRFSANTGLPTVLGWPVHEWLWRGSYDEAGKRVEEVKTIYTSKNINEVKRLLRKYNVKYAVVGKMEKEKYSNLNEKTFIDLGDVVYESGDTRVYLMN